VSENPFDLMRDAIAEANITIRAADRMTNSMASIIIGRLRHVDSWNLKNLKRELSQFNSHTGKWKEESK